MARFLVPDGSGCEINYDVRDGLFQEDVFFVHGNLASNRWWWPAEEHWKREASMAGGDLPGSLIYAEFRGCGGSTAPRDLSDVTMSRFADDFIGLIKTLNRPPMHLVGHSTGGLIVALMLAKEPTLFKKAVLLDPVGARGVTFDRSMISAFEKMKVDRDLAGAVIGSTIKGNDANSAFFQQVIVEDAFSSVKSVGHWVLEALDGLDSRQELAKVQAPVLVLHGEHDQLLPMADSQELAALLPNGRFEVFAGAGHCANIEQPAAFVKQVRGFLA